MNPNLAKLLQSQNKVVVLGVGSDLRGDDAVGLLIAEKIKEKRFPNVEVILGGTAPENFTGQIKKLKPSHLIIIDAAEMGEKPGTIKFLKPEELGGYTFTTHALPLKVMIDFILEDYKCEVIIVGVQPKDVSFGAPLSAEALGAVEALVA